MLRANAIPCNKNLDKSVCSARPTSFVSPFAGLSVVNTFCGFTKPSRTNSLTKRSLFAICLVLVKGQVSFAKAIHPTLSSQTGVGFSIGYPRSSRSMRMCTTERAPPSSQQSPSVETTVSHNPVLSNNIALHPNQDPSSLFTINTTISF